MDFNMLFHPYDHLNVISPLIPLLGYEMLIMMEEYEEEPKWENIHL